MNNHIPIPAAEEPDHVLADAPCRIATVILIVRDLARAAAFYRDVIGLAILSQGAGTVRLGVGESALLVLRHDPAARPRDPNDAGLFHTAFLLPHRGDLGAWLKHAETHGIALTGAADHLVSEAVYLDVPEGNGIEIYVDRHCSEWPRAQDGTIAMGNRPLDRAGIAAAVIGPWAALPANASIGHVHLQVGRLEEAERFYAGVLGLEVTCRYQGALLFGSGGYHHQLAGNIWNSRDAGVRSAGAAGLVEVALQADGTTLAAARGHARDAGLPLTEDGGALVLQDSWGTRLRLAAAA